MFKKSRAQVKKNWSQVSVMDCPLLDKIWIHKCLLIRKKWIEEKGKFIYSVEAYLINIERIKDLLLRNPHHLIEIVTEKAIFKWSTYSCCVYSTMIKKNELLMSLFSLNPSISFNIWNTTFNSPKCGSLCFINMYHIHGEEYTKLWEDSPMLDVFWTGRCCLIVSWRCCLVTLPDG